MATSTLELKIEQLRTRLGDLRAERRQIEDTLAVKRAALDAAITELDDAIVLLADATPLQQQQHHHRQPAGAVREAILAQLSSGNFGSMTVEELAAATKLKPASLRAALKALEEKGLISVSGDHWLLSNQEKARQAAKRTSQNNNEPHVEPAVAL